MVGFEADEEAATAEEEEDTRGGPSTALGDDLLEDFTVEAVMAGQEGWACAMRTGEKGTAAPPSAESRR